MSDKLREKLGVYLNDELDDLKFLRSVSPYAASLGSRSPRNRLSRSPRPNKTEQPEAPTIVHDSRPDIAAWPVPSSTAITTPFVSKAQLKPQLTISATSLAPTSPSPVPPDNALRAEESAKLLTMLKVVASSNPGMSREHEFELRQKIQILEETVAEYEHQKFNVMGTFRDYGERVAERERKLEAEYSNKIITLSEEVLGAKKDFETRMKSFQLLQEQFEREKEQALEKLRQEHQKEIQTLEQRFSQSQLLNLEQKYIIEIQRLEEERKSLRTEKERLGETFEMKLRRAQSLYETELTAAKLLYTKELEALRDHEDALKDELAARQEEFHDRLQEIQHQAKHSKDEMNNCKNEVALLERKLRKKELEVQNISRELSNARNETNEAFKKLNEARSDLEDLRKEYQEQRAELDRKSKLLNVAESTRRKLESTIRELQIEVKALKNKVDFLEMERDNLQSQSESQTQLHNSQVQALEAVLESVTKEKETTKEHYERLLEKEREQAEEREYSIKKEFSTKLNELEDQYNALREHIEQSDSFGPENVKLWEEIECLRSEKSTLEDEVIGLRTRLMSNQAKECEQDSELSLDYMVELLRAIDVVKKRVLQSRSQSSSRASANPEDTPTCSKNAVITKDLLECKAEESWQDQKGNHLKLQAMDLASIVEQLKELESSIDEIIMEKNEAKSKVEQLGEENKILMEKLEYFQNLNGAIESSSKNNEMTKTLEEYKNKVSELEDVAKRMSEEREKSLEEQRHYLEAMFADELNEEKARMEREIKELRERSESGFADEDTKKRVSDLEEENRRLTSELEGQSKEMKDMEQKADEYLRKREQEKSLEMEQKIIHLNKEHEKTVELIRQHENELEEELQSVKMFLEQSENKKDIEKQEDQTQTDDLSITEDEEIYEAGNLRCELDRLQEENNKKDEIIKQLQDKLAHHSEEHVNEDDMVREESAVLTNIKGRKDRSQSLIATSENVAMCKAASRLQSLVSQMSEKNDKSVSRPKVYNRERTTRDQFETTPYPTSSWMSRAKSPNYLSPLRENSPLKLKFDGQEHTMSSGSSHHRSLLSPSDVSDRRRISPSRQLFMKNSDKRPAWKF
ncbi:hypothetical protein Ddc_00835 [Ditylenchus destructor]|nr:hypothetical protein Ddc_00835 [Ditylenchus destructor]